MRECHSRICGKIADQVLERIAKENGEIAKDAVINWDKETWEYIYREFESELAWLNEMNIILEMLDEEAIPI